MNIPGTLANCFSYGQPVVCSAAAKAKASIASTQSIVLSAPAPDIGASFALPLLSRSPWLRELPRRLLFGWLLAVVL